jgi:hypothetical protein
VLEAAIDMPRPPTAPAGFGFPSVAVTMTTIVFGFFAVLIARELPGRKRVWPYLLAGVVTTLVGFARLYLGAHWWSDLLGGTLLGILWLLVLGIAYRRHVARSFWMRPLAWVFYGSFVLAAAWHAPHAADPLLAKFAAAPPTHVLTTEDWWQREWSSLPERRSETDVRRRWPLDVQVAGPLAPLQAALEAEGWRVQPQADWVHTIGLLDSGRAPSGYPVLPATLDAQAEALLMVRDGATAGELHALRLWRAPVALADGTPLWIGTAQSLQLGRPLNVLSLWRPAPDSHATYVLVRDGLQRFTRVEQPHPTGGMPVLRLRTDNGTALNP